MTALLAELRAKWEETRASRPGDRQWRAIALSGAAPVRLLAAVRDRDGRSSVLLETSLDDAPRHRIPFQAEGISVADERSADDGLLRLAVTLERPDLQDIFEVLAVDLILVAASAPSAALAVQHAIQRLEAWQVCLRVRRRGLTREELVGLLGELAILTLASAECSLSKAVAAWQGPLDGIHDFETAGVAIEVKATLGIAHQVRISRLDQLDPEGLDALILARVRFHEAPGGHSLAETVAGLRKTIAERCPASVAEFEDKLMRAGYLDADAEVYAPTRTVLHELRCFRISGDFPRLTRAIVPAAITDAAYALDERLLAPFRVQEDEWRALLRRMGGVAHER